MIPGFKFLVITTLTLLMREGIYLMDAQMNNFLPFVCLILLISKRMKGNSPPFVALSS